MIVCPWKIGLLAKLLKSGTDLITALLKYVPFQRSNTASGPSGDQQANQLSWKSQESLIILAEKAESLSEAPNPVKRLE